jgi:hypothetical protein
MTVKAAQLLPPDFQRHCAAVASWGYNLGAITSLIPRALITLQSPGMLGRAPVLISKDAGESHSHGKCQGRPHGYQNNQMLLICSAVNINSLGCKSCPFML